VKKQQGAFYREEPGRAKTFIQKAVQFRPARGVEDSPFADR
jgi:hypothetical protein